MKRNFLLAAALLGSIALSASCAFGEDTAAPTAATQPWQRDQALLASVKDVARSNGISALQPHVQDIEQALAGAKLVFDVQENGGTTRYVLTDGMSDELIAMSLAAADKSHPVTKTIAVDNPYPILSLYLGSYYNEIGRSDQALRILDVGLSLDVMSSLGIGGDLQPVLMSEKGAALISLKRFLDALADYDAALKISGLDDNTQALLGRGRGFALTELGRLDDATAAYQESLKHEPGNEHAQHELDYIAKLRAGAPEAPGGLRLAHPSASDVKPGDTTIHS